MFCRLTRFCFAITALCVALLSAGEAQAQWSGHRFGAGFRMGDPSGITAKYWLSRKEALQFDFGWRAAYRRSGANYYYAEPSFSIDWVHQFARFGPRSRTVWFGAHIGAGGSIDMVPASGCNYDALGYQYCSNAVAARMPVAINLYLARIRLEILFEMVPGLRIIPNIKPTMAGSVAIRYYF